MIKFSWQGDINTDFNRKSKYVDIVREALDDLDVKSVWNKFPVDFTFCSPTDTFFSTIDHFLASQSLEDIIKDAGDSLWEQCIRSLSYLSQAQYRIPSSSSRTS